MELEDSKIVDLYWQRSEQAVPETAVKYGSYCRTIAYNILSDAQDAEECVNDTYLKAWNSMPTNRPSRLAPYLGKLSRWISLTRLRERNALRRGGGEVSLVLDELSEALPGREDIQKTVELKELGEAVHRFLAGIDETEAQVFLARCWYMAPIAEIADRLGFHREQGQLHAAPHASEAAAFSEGGRIMLNQEMLLFALNDMDDGLLESTRRRLGYRIRQRRNRRKLWRTLLIAALISALMIGTAYAAGLIGLGNLRAGELFGTKVLSMEGLSDSPEGQALREWLAYYNEHRNDPFDPEEAFALQDAYGSYGATTKEMAAKVDELCEKYGLEKLGKLSCPPDEKSFWQAAGVGKLTRGTEAYENDYMGGYVYPGGTFQYDGELFPAAEAYAIPYQFRRAMKGSFGYVVTNAGDPNDYTEWTYKTADGTALTISDSPSGAFLLMDRTDCFVTVSISKSGLADYFNDGFIDGIGDAFVSFDLSHEQLEAIAETFNWKALDDPKLGMDGDFRYHQYAEHGSASLISEAVDLSLLEGNEALKVAVSAVYEQQIAPYIRDFELVDYSLEWGSAAMGWISFRGMPKKALDWRRVPTEDGELYCRSVLVTMNEQGMPVAGESFDMLPIEKLGNSRNIGTAEKLRTTSGSGRSERTSPPPRSMSSRPERITRSQARRISRP